MESFRRLKQYFRFLGLVRLSQNRNEHIFDITMNCLMFSIFIQQSLATTYFFAFDAQTFRDYVESFFYVCYALQSFAWYTMNFFNRFKYAQFSSELDGIIAQRSINPGSRSIYQETHRRVENLSLRIHNIMMTLYYLFIVPVNLKALFQYISSGYSTENFEQFVPLTYPFDWRTPIGFAAYMLAESITVFAIIKVIICSLASILGHCIYAADFISDLEVNLRNFNEEFSKINDSKMNYRQQLELRTKFIENIQFHSNAREFANRLIALDCGLIFFYLLYAVVSYCSTFLQINALLAAGDVAVIFQELLPPTMTSLSTLYALCHFGDHLTERFNDVGHAFYQLPWYQFPLNMQQDLKFVIAAAHRQVLLRGYAGTYCTREVYKKIINTTFSYYTVLRGFES